MDQQKKIAVFPPSTESFTKEGRKLPQYCAALSATLGALAFGSALGWSTAAGDNGVDLIAEYGVPMSISEFSWMGSITNVGAALMCLPIGTVMDHLGRRPSMLLLVIPFTIGWALLIWSNSVAMFCIGRFLVGVGGGAFCVAIPVYTAEIGETSIRGSLGSYVELMLCAGVVISYSLGAFATIYQLSLVCAMIPLIFLVVFYFMPESPIYCLMKNREDLARASLLWLRGPNYDIEKEINIHKTALEEEARNKGSFLEGIRSKAAQKGIVIAYGLMIFQQLSGINAIVFYTGTVFGKTGSISPEISTIIVGALQVPAVFISTLLVDRAGRKILLLISIISMSIGTFAVGIYFYLEHIKADVSQIWWLPLIAVSFYIFMISIGIGPIPWMMVGEIFSPQIKGIAGSSAGFLNWMMAFIVTRFYNDLLAIFGQHTMFWIFSVICAMGAVFVVFIVPETKGKSLEQIQIELSGKPVPECEITKA
ncbi:facilitated trehalose transporter Tret1-like [Athalia rosae]|uniref:facilitated trehalose transporter Tret1-like n=1 Tax=Athalia rosae TaxID=37344 RepID=UPI00062638CF|nr:facilitated trehalose transporter Tret1-like [Athalia rosae]